MKKIASAWLCLLLIVALPLGALAEGGSADAEVLSGAVEPTVSEADEAPVPGDACDNADRGASASAGGALELPDDLVIKGRRGSTAEAYAAAHDIRFAVPDATEHPGKDYFAEAAADRDRLIAEARAQYLAEDYTHLDAPVRYNVLWLGVHAHHLRRAGLSDDRVRPRLSEGCGRKL